MPKLTPNIKAEEIKNLDKYIEKIVEKKVQEKIASFFEENDIDIEKLKEKLNKKELKALE